MSNPSTALTVVDRTTGEVLQDNVFDFASYLSTVRSADAIKRQQMLSAAYDSACAALIGPNDIQKEGGREFKRKSAWRKLARHFGISVATSLESVRVERSEGGFTAYAVANAVAPWGQSWTDVGACGSDEATGKRVITVADAVATAMTRAANRAVSNLIAMGEVSAEEVQRNRQTERAEVPAEITRDTVWPFGKMKGKAIRELTNKFLAWAAEGGRKFGNPDETARWQKAIRDEIDARAMNQDEQRQEEHPAASTASHSAGVAPEDDFEQFPGALEDEDDDLPF